MAASIVLGKSLKKLSTRLLYIDSLDSGSVVGDPGVLLSCGMGDWTATDNGAGVVIAMGEGSGEGRSDTDNSTGFDSVGMKGVGARDGSCCFGS